MRIAAVAAACALAVVAARGQDDRYTPPAPGFGAAASCGACHDLQYGTWRRGPHAEAAVRETFRSTFRAARRDLGDEAAARRCLACHAPAAVAAGDLALETSIGREGVTCDVCHSVVGVGRIGTPAPFDMRVGRVKYGPYGDGSAVEHEIAKGTAISSDALCAGCHQADLSTAFVAYGTLSEHRSGRWASTRCLECHMPGRVGRIAAGGPVRPIRRDHEMLASDSAWYGRGLRLEVAVERAARGAGASDRVVVRLSNPQGAHAAPTGHPDARLEVRVLVLDADGRPLVADSRFLGKVLADADGRSPVPFWRAAIQRRDDRLRPDETREYHWWLPRDRAATADVRVYRWSFDPALAEVYGIEVDPVEVLSASWRPTEGGGLRDL